MPVTGGLGDHSSKYQKIVYFSIYVNCGLGEGIDSYSETGAANPEKYGL